MENPSAETCTAFCLKQIVRGVRSALTDPSMRREFEQWYAEEYGVPYIWKHHKEVQNVSV